MKIVIWGAGTRGRRLIRFVGRNRVVAFIDMWKDLQGTYYDNVPIISFEEYLKNYRSYFIVITPIMGTDRILSILKEYDVSKVFLLRDCPDNFCDYSYEELMKHVSKEITGENNILYGINYYSILLYDYLKENEKIIKILPQIDGINSPIVQLLSEDGYDITHQSLSQNFNVYITCKTDESDAWSKENYRCNFKSVYDFSELPSRYMNKTIKKIKGSHSGKRCFIVATGPSLKIQDLDKLYASKDICISMNGIYHAFLETQWRPQYFVYSDQSAHKFQDIIDSMDVEYKFVSDQCDEFWEIQHPDNVYKFHTMFCENELRFSEDFMLGTYTGGNVTYNCIQLAVYLGCNEIYLLGTDCNFDGYKNRKNVHFTDDYMDDSDVRKGISIVTNVYTDSEMEEAQLRTYRAAKKYADTHSIKICNATRGGKLEIFPRVDFDSLFEYRK